MSKEQLLQAVAEAFEACIATATEAAQRGVIRRGNTWGPRETIAHMAGWEVMASVCIPKIVAGMPPLEYEDETLQTAMDDAINATIVTMIGDQSLATLCGILRQAYQRNIEMLRSLDEKFFQAGEYVYERMNGIIEHCQEHTEQLVRSQL